MVRSLEGLRLLITGASGGIGRCLAEQAVRAGARVALAARSAAPLEAAVAELATAVMRSPFLPTSPKRRDGSDCSTPSSTASAASTFS
jgi:NAD(P)-dependent dehydrogenase (short-subunit alcohol dehydrogenase family)